MPFLRIGRFIRFEPAAISAWLDSSRVARSRAKQTPVTADDYATPKRRNPASTGLLLSNRSEQRRLPCRPDAASSAGSAGSLRAVTRPANN
jgi:hypothetical protein